MGWDNVSNTLNGKKKTYIIMYFQASFGYRLIYSNLWLFSGLMASEMEQSRATRPFLRTTTAITKFNSGIKVSPISFTFSL